MNALPKISTHGIIEGVRAKKDRSLGLNISTPELTSEEKAMFMELQGQNLVILFVPVDAEEVKEHEVKSDLNQKTPSERMRAVLYILWKQKSENLTDFPTFYNDRMNSMIEKLKERIDN